VPEAASHYDLRQPPDHRRASANPSEGTMTDVRRNRAIKRRTGAGYSSNDESPGQPKPSARPGCLENVGGGLDK
jgi:hypothetical protein